MTMTNVTMKCDFASQIASGARAFFFGRGDIFEWQQNATLLH
jgi:hypothetical protein